MSLRCEACGAWLEPDNVTDDWHVVIEEYTETGSAHARDASCMNGDCLNCPIPVPIPAQRQAQCGPVRWTTDQQGVAE